VILVKALGTYVMIKLNSHKDIENVTRFNYDNLERIITIAEGLTLLFVGPNGSATYFS